MHILSQLTDDSNREASFAGFWGLEEYSVLLHLHLTADMFL